MDFTKCCSAFLGFSRWMDELMRSVSAVMGVPENLIKPQGLVLWADGKDKPRPMLGESCSGELYYGEDQDGKASPLA